ncbi:hypothetical protein HanHA300_Chr07g0242451 [Helianthus annuus]|nr:hypothetical protein HanHA300_Chr07g0242451 [Helianthus annuus]KAJ0563136.1 hypothetical protein HanHA89_Chr07g0259661 [Helianthus annuus]KAJ0728503.1 hypothetical protein HanLR1_Chr07g0242341 [Helianthus annuus]KAJ0731254.1 hypothetical protein HanOQP8_Chr07g0249841 [Helianthus annuus]
MAPKTQRGYSLLDDYPYEFAVKIEIYRDVDSASLVPRVATLCPLGVPYGP